MSLDPRAARLVREELQAEARPELEALDPPWPFRRLEFDPFFFNLDREAVPPVPSPFPEPI